MDTIDGLVIKTNGTGFKLEGREKWLNISKFANPVPKMPGIGEHVRLFINSKGYVVGVENLPELQLDQVNPVRLQSAEEETGLPKVPSREVVISRLAVINSAISVLKTDSRPIDLRQVLEIALKLEAWAYRSL